MGGRLVFAHPDNVQAAGAQAVGKVHEIPVRTGDENGLKRVVRAQLDSIYDQQDVGCILARPSMHDLNSRRRAPTAQMHRIAVAPDHIGAAQGLGSLPY